MSTIGRTRGDHSDLVPLCAAGPSSEGGRGRGANRLCGVQERDGDHFARSSTLRFLADGLAAPNNAALGPPVAPYRDETGQPSRRRQNARRTGMGGGRAGHHVQAARDRRGAGPRQHAGPARSGRRVSTAYACRRRGAAPAGRRAVVDDRKLFPGDYMMAEPGTRRRRLERDRLHLRPHHQHQRHPSLKVQAHRVIRLGFQAHTGRSPLFLRARLLRPIQELAVDVWWV